MGKLLLSLHVLAAIVFVGPVTVATSLFPRFARQGDRPTGGLALLHRVSRLYAVLGLSVPVLGLALAARLGVLDDPWLAVSIALTLVAALLLALVILPGQARLLATGAAAPEPTAVTARVAVAPGLFSLLWAVVVVLMVVRPGSTTGV